MSDLFYWTGALVFTVINVILTVIILLAIRNVYYSVRTILILKKHRAIKNIWPAFKHVFFTQPDIIIPSADQKVNWPCKIVAHEYHGGDSFARPTYVLND